MIAAVAIGKTVASGDEGVQIAEFDAQLAPWMDSAIDRRAAEQ